MGGKLLKFLHIPYWCKSEQPDIRQHNGIIELKILKRNCACESCFVKII